MGEDRSSFGYLTYREAKERKDILSRRFSKKAVVEGERVVEGIVCIPYFMLNRLQWPMKLS
jgi:hypothetical protein